jgi:hypothetical protein
MQTIPSRRQLLLDSEQLHAVCVQLSLDLGDPLLQGRDLGVELR